MLFEYSSRLLKIEETLDYMDEKTMVLLEQIRTIEKKRIRHYIGKLGEKDMEQVDFCLGISLDLKIV